MARGRKLEGSWREDRLIGASGDDEILGYGGDDRLEGEGGDDTLSGGDGEDRLDGGSGEDSLEGGSRDDRLEGGSGADTLSGGSGDDRLDGGSGRDVLIGGAGDDTIDGGSGDDVAVFEGPASGLTLSWLRNGDIEVRGADGTDRLSDVETLKIGGMTYEIGGKGAILKDERASLTENQTVTLDVLDNDFALKQGATLTIQKLGGGKAANGDLVAKTAEGAEVRYQNGKLVVDPKAAFDYLAKGQTATTTFTYAVSTGGAINTAEVRLTVTGVNDAATIKATTPGSDVGTAKPDQLTAAGRLTVTDPDQGESVFKAPANLAGTYGTFTFNAATGAWGYSADPAKLGGLNGTAVETLTVTSKDGTDSHAITVTVTGGTVGPQPIAGDSGNNSLMGGAGTDTIDGKAGNDTIDGQGGHDILFGSVGDDAIFLRGSGLASGALGNDTLWGGSAQSIVTGEDGNDSLIAGSGPATVSGGTGDDFLVGGAGNDSLDGGAGNDSAAISASLSQVSLSWLPGGVLQVVGPDGADRISGVETLYLNGVAYNLATAGALAKNDAFSLTENQALVMDVLANDFALNGGTLVIQKQGGGAAANGDVVASIGDGTLVRYQDGKLVLDASPGFNNTPVGQVWGTSFTYAVANGTGNISQALVTLAFTGVNDPATIMPAFAGWDAGIVNAGQLNASGRVVVTDLDFQESVYQAPSGLTGIYGAFTFNTLNGTWSYAADPVKVAALNGSATETLTVTSKDGTATHAIIVTVNGVIPGQTLTGDDSDNTLTGGAGDDTIDGKGGNDSVSGGEGDDILTLAGGGQIAGGGGHDTLQSGAGHATLTGALGDDMILVGSGGGVINGGGGDDSIQGGAGFTSINGDAGNDYIVLSTGGGGAGGGLGADTLIGTAGDDMVWLGELGANDSVDGGGGVDHTGGGVSNGDDVVALSEAGHLTVNGSLVGVNVEKLTAAGNGGHDTIQSSSGFASLAGNDGDDWLILGSGGGSASGDVGNDTLVGVGGGDTLVGGVGDDRLDAGAAGVGARNTLSGGSGADQFVLSTSGDSGVVDTEYNVITDWQTSDTLDLAGVGGGGFDYFEMSAANYADALAGADANAVASARDSVTVVQVGADLVVFVDADNNNAVEDAIGLVGRTLNDVSLANIA